MTAQETELSENVLMHFVREHNSIDAQIAGLQAKRKNLRSSIKSNGVKLKNFDRVFAEFNAVEDDQYLEDLRQQRNMARLLSMPLGTQISFFDDPEGPPAPASSNGGGAFQQGVRSFLAGGKENQNPFTDGEQNQDWLRGFRYAEDATKDGKDSALGIKKTAKAPPAAAGKKKRGRPSKKDLDGAALQ